MMLTGMPNFVYAVGYTNASWTLKVDLTCSHFIRLLELMDDRGYDWAEPEEPDGEVGGTPLINLASGYVLRAADRFPKQSPREPWLLRMDYLDDRRMLLDGPVGDHLRMHRVESSLVKG
jgi:hypothetical protein